MSDVVSTPHGYSTRRPFPDVLEDKQVEVYGWADAGAALDLLRADRERWLGEQARSVEQP